VGAACPCLWDRLGMAFRRGIEPRTASSRSAKSQGIKRQFMNDDGYSVRITVSTLKHSMASPARMSW
jgi:hypothetical protein